jgi:hypothetical protein
MTLMAATQIVIKCSCGGSFFHQLFLFPEFDHLEYLQCLSCGHRIPIYTIVQNEVKKCLNKKVEKSELLLVVV